MPEVASRNSAPASTPDDRLESWKEIAAFLKRDVSTVQRWEKREGLPVHRLPHDKLGSVFAFKPELDAWWNRGRDRLEAGGAPPSWPSTNDALVSRRGLVAAAMRRSFTALRASRRSVLAGGAALLVGLIVGGSAVWLALSSRSDTVEPAAPVLRAILPFASGESLPHIVAGSSIAISPDGRYVAYVTRRGESWGLTLRALDSLEAKAIDVVGRPSRPFFSPDSAWLAFATEHPRGLMRVAVSGGAPVWISSLVGNPRGVSWSRQGFVFTQDSSSGLFRIARTGDSPQALTTLDADRREKSHRFPQVLPGDESVLFTIGTSRTDTWDNGLIVVGSLATGEYKVVHEGGSDARYSTSGHLVYARAGSLLAVPFDLQRLEVTGQPVEVVADVMMTTSGGGAEFALSDTGTLVYAPGRSRTEDRRIVWVDRQGKTEPIIDTPGPYTALALSPDGGSVALQLQGGLETIVIYDIDRRTFTHWTSEWDNSSPLWSPDGREIVFTSSRASNWDLFKGPVDDSQKVELIATSDFVKVPTSWSRDGKVVAFQTGRDETGHDIFVLTLNGERRPEPLVTGRANEAAPAFSPDGRWIAYQSDETGRPEIYVCSFPGCQGKRPVSNDGGTYPKWNPKGGELFYRNGNKMVAVAIATGGDGVTLGTPFTLFERSYGPTLFSAFDVSPDGTRFVDLDDSVAEPPATHLVLVHNFGEELKRRVPTRK